MALTAFPSLARCLDVDPKRVLASSRSRTGGTNAGRNNSWRPGIEGLNALHNTKMCTWSGWQYVLFASIYSPHLEDRPPPLIPSPQNPPFPLPTREPPHNCCAQGVFWERGSHLAVLPYHRRTLGAALGVPARYGPTCVWSLGVRGACLPCSRPTDARVTPGCVFL